MPNGIFYTCIVPNWIGHWVVDDRWMVHFLILRCLHRRPSHFLTLQPPKTIEPLDTATKEEEKYEKKTHKIQSWMVGRVHAINLKIFIRWVVVYPEQISMTKTMTMGTRKKMYQQWRHYNGITPSKNVLFAYTIVMNRTHINISIESIRWPVCTLNDIVNTHSIHLNN